MARSVPFADCEKEIHVELELGILHLEQQLMSGDLEVQVRALEKVNAAISVLLKIAVEGFAATDNATICADKLAPLGPVIVPDLEALYISHANSQKKTMLAILLLHLGSCAGLSDVLGAVNRSDPNQFLATNKLASAGVRDAVEPITTLLRIYVSSGDPCHILSPKIASLIEALKKLDAEIPIDIKPQMLAAGWLDPADPPH